MTGRKSLAEVRAELEAALGSGPPGGGTVAESLRRFLSGKTAGEGKKPAPLPPGIPTAPRVTKRVRRKVTT